MGSSPILTHALLLLFVRSLHNGQLSGLTNALLLLLTLKLAALGFDSSDGTAPAHSTRQLLQYICCFYGIFTGALYALLQ